VSVTVHGREPLGFALTMGYEIPTQTQTTVGILLVELAEDSGSPLSKASSSRCSARSSEHPPGQGLVFAGMCPSQVPGFTGVSRRTLWLRVQHDLSKDMV